MLLSIHGVERLVVPTENSTSEPNLVTPVARVTAIIGVTAVVLGNIATILGSLESLKKFIFSEFGIENLRQIHGILYAVVCGLFIIGFLLLAVWTFKRFVHGGSRLTRIAYGAAVAVGAGILAYGEIRLLPATPQLKPILTTVRSSWVNEILTFEKSSGGFRFSRANASDEAQAWTTGQALTALTGSQMDSSVLARTAQDSYHYLESIRLQPPSDGWGYMPGQTWGVTEINAWVTRAYEGVAKFNNQKNLLNDPQSAVFAAAIRKNLEEIFLRQHPEGGWGPNRETTDPAHMRTYSTILALWALSECGDVLSRSDDERKRYETSINEASQWLMGTYKPSIGWVPHPFRAVNPTDRYPALTAQTLFVLGLASTKSGYLKSNIAFAEAKEAFLKSAAQCAGDPATCPMERNDRVIDSDRYLRNSPYMAEASTFLWFPWTMALLDQITTDSLSTHSMRESAASTHQLLSNRINEYVKFAQQDSALYPTLEGLIVVNRFLDFNK